MSGINPFNYLKKEEVSVSNLQLNNKPLNSFLLTTPNNVLRHIILYFLDEYKKPGASLKNFGILLSLSKEFTQKCAQSISLRSLQNQFFGTISSSTDALGNRTFGSHLFEMILVARLKQSTPSSIAPKVFKKYLMIHSQLQLKSRNIFIHEWTAYINTFISKLAKKNYLDKITLKLINSAFTLNLHRAITSKQDNYFILHLLNLYNEAILHQNHYSLHEAEEFLSHIASFIKDKLKDEKIHEYKLILEPILKIYEKLLIKGLTQRYTPSVIQYIAQFSKDEFNEEEGHICNYNHSKFSLFIDYIKSYTIDDRVCYILLNLIQDSFTYLENNPPTSPEEKDCCMRNYAIVFQLLSTLIAYPTIKPTEQAIKLYYETNKPYLRDFTRSAIGRINKICVWITHFVKSRDPNYFKLLRSEICH